MTKSVVATSSVASVSPVLLKLFLRDLFFLLLGLSSRLKSAEHLGVSHLLILSGEVIAPSVASLVESVVVSVVLTVAVASVVLRLLELFLGDISLLWLGFRNRFNLTTEELNVRLLLLLTLKVAVALSVASSVVSVVTSVDVALSVASDVVVLVIVLLEFLLSDFDLLLSSFSLRLELGEYLGISKLFLALEVTVTTTVTSSVVSVVISVVATSSVASVVPVLLELFLSDLSVLISLGNSSFSLLNRTLKEL